MTLFRFLVLLAHSTPVHDDGVLANTFTVVAGVNIQPEYIYPKFYIRSPEPLQFRQAKQLWQASGIVACAVKK